MVEDGGEGADEDYEGQDAKGEDKGAAGDGLFVGYGPAAEESEDHGGAGLGGAEEGVDDVGDPGEGPLGAGELEKEQGQSKLEGESGGDGLPGEGAAALADGPGQSDEKGESKEGLKGDEDGHVRGFPGGSAWSLTVYREWRGSQFGLRGTLGDESPKPPVCLGS